MGNGGNNYGASNENFVKHETIAKNTHVGPPPSLISTPLSEGGGRITPKKERKESLQL